MKKIVFIIGSLSALFFTACQKELSDNFSTYTGHPLNDTIWARNVSGGASVHELTELLMPEIIVDSFEVSRDTTLKYGDSLEVTFTAGSCIGTGIGGGPTGTLPPGKVNDRDTAQFVSRHFVRNLFLCVGHRLADSPSHEFKQAPDGRWLLGDVIVH